MLQSKWRRVQVLLENLEVVEAPVYRGSRGRIFKVLFSTACRMDCRYCPWRAGSPVERVTWSPEKLAKTALTLYKRGIISAVFISSCLFGDPELVTERIIEAAELLRSGGYQGYLHLRLMPGTPTWLIREASKLADRVGVNLETVDPSGFAEVAPSKGSWSLDILSKLLYAARLHVSVDTQVVVGVADESDKDHIMLMKMLAEQGIDVVYHSPFTPIPWTPLRDKPATPRDRAARLHQVWRLLREYRLDPKLILDILDDSGMLPRVGDVKEEIARRHPELYPVNPWTATKQELLLVPGIGPKTADRIIAEREEGRLTLDKLRKLLGPRWKKAAKYLDLGA